MHQNLRAILAVTLCLGVVSCRENDVARIEVARRHIELYGDAPLTLAAPATFIPGRQPEEVAP